MKPQRISLGLDQEQKEALIAQWLRKHQDIRHIVCFYPDGWEHLSIDECAVDAVEYIPFSETIMYRTFYPLLQRINQHTLLIMDECMRVKNRGDLHYSCMHHYCNQTEYKLIFEQFPFIDDKQDFMILLDFLDKPKYKGKSYDDSMLDEVDLAVMQHDYELTKEDEILPLGAKEQYQKEKQKLFDNLGLADPDTIPSALQLFAGKYKKPRRDRNYAARNKRYKRENVKTFAECSQDVTGAVSFVDLPLRQKVFNDILTKTRQRKVEFLSSGLKIDEYLFKRYQDWFTRVKRFCHAAETGIHRR